MQEYVAIYSPPFSQNVVLRTAPNPEGPWSTSQTAFVAMQPLQGNVYLAHAHPEYEANGGQTIFVTYSRARLLEKEISEVARAWHMRLARHPAISPD